MIRIVTVAAFAVLATPAWADTLRCGNSIIQEGDTQGYVQDKCGEPASKQTYTEPVYGRYPNGNTYSAGTTSKDVWRYQRSNGSFPAVLTFEKGVLKKLEFEK